MKLETKFNIGDFVYSINYKEKVKELPVDCLTCDSTGKILIKNDYFKCPKCYGKIKREHEGVEWYICNSGNIDKVVVEVEELESPDIYDFYVKVKYSLNSTTNYVNYKEENLFLDKEEALKECEIRTKNHSAS